MASRHGLPLENCQTLAGRRETLDWQRSLTNSFWTLGLAAPCWLGSLQNRLPTHRHHLDCWPGHRKPAQGRWLHGCAARAYHVAGTNHDLCTTTKHPTEWHDCIDGFIWARRLQRPDVCRCLPLRLKGATGCVWLRLYCPVHWTSAVLQGILQDLLGVEPETCEGLSFEQFWTLKFRTNSAEKSFGWMRGARINTSGYALSARCQPYRSTETLSQYLDRFFHPFTPEYFPADVHLQGRLGRVLRYVTMGW